MSLTLLRFKRDLWQRAFCVVVLFIAPKLNAAGTELNLKQAIAYGIEHSPRMISSAATRENAKFDLANARAQLLPTFDADANASAQYVTSPEFGNSGPTHNRSIGVSMNANLWDGGIKSFAIDAAKSRLDAAELDYAQSRDQLVLDIVKAFYDYSESTLAIQSHVEHQKMLERQARDIDEAFHQGLKLKRDAVRIQTEVQRQEIIVIAANDQAAQMREKLLTLIGASLQLNGKSSDPQWQFQVIQPEKTPSLSAKLVGDAGALDISQTTLAKKQRLDEQTAQYTLEAERRRRTWPTIDLSLGSSYRLNQSGGREQPTIFGREGVTWSAGIGLRYPLWDWGIREREIATLVNDQKKLSADRSIALDEMRQRMIDIKRILTQSEKNLKLSADLLKLEEEANSSIVLDYKQGRASYLDLVDEAQRLREAKLAHAKSYFDWQRSAWDFKFYAGGLFDVVQSL